MTPRKQGPDPEAALRHYPLQAPVVLRRDDVGIINDNWLVSDSASGRTYVLRDYRRVTASARIAFQIVFQQHLLASGFPTAPVVRTNGGELYASVGGLYWTLFGFVEGEPFDYASLPQAREAGKGLARFEAVAANYTGPVVAPPLTETRFGRAPVSSYVWRTSVLAVEQEQHLCELFAGQGFDEELGFLSRWRRNASETWPRERLDALPQAWLHCDYHGRNMVFQGDGLAGLFDFDYVTRGPRTLDVGRGIVKFAREQRGSTILREEFCRAFLDGYESLQPLSEEERKALPFMAILNRVPDATFYAARLEEAGDPGIGKRLQHDVKRMRATQAEMQRLAPRFGWEAI
jgi:Ser/Thr protein kinase RdoA (MazF antagonist)